MENGFASCTKAACCLVLTLLLLSACRSTDFRNPADEPYGIIDLAAELFDGPPAEEAYRAALDQLDAVTLGFRFDDPAGLGNWKGYGGLEALQVLDGALRTRVTGADPRLACYIRSFETDLASRLLVEMSVEGGEEAVFLWRPEGERYAGVLSKSFPLVADGRFHVYRVPLTEGLLPLLDSKSWSGTIDALRLDLPEQAGTVAIRKIELVQGPDREMLMAERLRHGLDRSVTLRRTTRPVLPAGSAEIDISVPPDARLTFSTGVMGHAWKEAPPERRFHFRVRFVPGNVDGGGPHELFSEVLAPTLRRRHQGWSTHTLALQELAGMSGRLLFETAVGPVGREPRWDGTWSGGVWGSPRLACPAGSRADRPPNLLLISLDTLRADRLSSYGHTRRTTPQIDRRLAARGMQMAFARSSAPWTLPAHVSLMTGLDTLHRFQRTPGPIPGREATLAELLRGAGYRTEAVTGGANLGPEWGFHRGFHRYAVRRVLHRAVDEAVGALQGLDGAPFFLFFHTYETHAGYRPREPWFTGYEPVGYQGEVRGSQEELLRFNREGTVLTEADKEHLRALYDSEVSYTDHQIGQLFARLERSGLLDNTLVVLLSDHGEEFGDHGGYEHGRNLYDALLRVPMLFSMPGVIPAGKLSSEPATMVDVLPTILDLLGMDGPEGINGRSLAATLHGDEERRAGPDLLQAASVTNPLYGDRKFALFDGRFKVVYHPDDLREEYIDLLADPGESAPGRAPLPEAKAGEMMRLLKQRLEAEGLAGESDTTENAPPLSEETLSRLRQLGYLE